MTSETVGLLVEFKAKYDETKTAFGEVLKGGDKVLANNDKMDASFTALGRRTAASMSSIVGGLSVLSAGIVGVGGLFYTFAAKIGESIDQVTDKARGLGIAATDFQKLSYAASLGGVGIDSVTASLQKFDINVGKALSGNKDAIDSFRNIGISVDQLKGKDLTSQFLLSATAASHITDKNLAASASAQVFGKSYVNALQLGRDGISENVKEFDTLGIALTDVQRKSVDAFGDSQTKLSALFSGFGQHLVAEVAPALTELTEGVSSFITKNGGIGKIAENVGQSVVTIIKGATATFQTIADTVGWLLNKLAALEDNKVIKVLGSGVASALGPREDTFASNLSGFLGAIFDTSRVDSLTDPFPYDVNTTNYKGAYTGYKPNNVVAADSTIPNYKTGGKTENLVNSTELATAALTGLSKAATDTAKATRESTDAITQAFKAMNAKAGGDELNKIFDIIAKDTADKRPLAKDQDVEKWAAQLIQDIRGGQLSSTAYNEGLSNLRKLKSVNDFNGFNTDGQQSVIDQIQKYAAATGQQEKQVNVTVTVAPTDDFIVKVAKESYTNVTDIIQQVARNAARMGAK